MLLRRSTTAAAPLGLLALFLSVPSEARAHASLVSPRPRVSQTLKTGPCGGIPRRGTPLIAHPGETIMVEWDEYVDHPGYYQILFSMGGDSDFRMLLDAIPDVEVPVGQTRVRYSAPVTLPDEPCEAGTLQLIQYMTENPDRPELYFSCADVVIVAEEPFRRGDANDDGRINISDALTVFDRLFVSGGGFPCADAADTNDDGKVDIADGILTLNVLFSGDSSLPGPGPESCGEDESAEAQGCSSYLSCGS
jgi:hypothetical protein